MRRGEPTAPSDEGVLHFAQDAAALEIESQAKLKNTGFHGSGDLAVGTRTQIVRNRIKVRMIPNVESLDSKFQLCLFANGKGLKKRPVPCLFAWPADESGSSVSKETEGWRYSSDTGWKNWDIRIYGNQFWSVQVATVTEYHGGPKCLTRVRLTYHAVVTTVLMLSGGPALYAPLTAVQKLFSTQ